MVGRVDVPEAPLEQTEHGLVCKGEGWFVANARETRWRRRGESVFSNLGGDILFDQLGIGVSVLAPGQPMAAYHWETDQEDFLILSGEGTLVIEGRERSLKQWDFVHCPSGTKHVIIGGPCVVLSVGSRERHTMLDERGQRVGRPDWGEYVADPVAAKYGAAPEETTTSPDEAYAHFPPIEPAVRYGGWLPDL
jgi:mannose-6-phosphate isomerase-like protein (cupin superfamily)